MYTKLILSKLEFTPATPQVKRGVLQLLAFGYLNAISCFFPVLIFMMLSVSKVVHIPFLPRYDFLLLACLTIQAIMYFNHMETKDELLVITLFHLLGLALEIHKVNVGSWSYPEDAYTKIAGVPLYSGFMYASVASYITQAWRHFDLKIEKWPRPWLAFSIGAAIYLNFYTNAFFQDMRYFIIPLLLLVFFKTRVYFTTLGVTRWMPLSLSFLLIGFFIWMAENIATFLGAWKYAYQHSAWQMVTYSKITSWFLLIVVSIIIVAQLKKIKEIGDPLAFLKSRSNKKV